MVYFQSNTARLIYTLSTTPKTKSAQLKNGLFLNKEEKSDEKLLFTENNMTNIIQTVMFMFLFKYFPIYSMNEIIFKGDSIYSLIDYNIPDLSIVEFKNLLDYLFGEGFSYICSRPLLIVYSEYRKKWSLAKYGERIKTPNTSDFVNVFRFINTVNPSYSESVSFIIDNTKDFKYKWQQNEKTFD